ncbi:NAD(P)-dependent oxidoreductase [Mycobacterium sp. CBMA293]|uniref:NAD(P)-dependent oxidoreductase n=1 Tax=unclassified Mycolicibacterium TaxID=2636767 RepID=UPI0012DDD43B|nr:MULTISPECIES: NAD(P)-dependent oxidoreductase [unclassified Mycolicibacterium]MUL49409.1 NAD(P)-dependent oxidoreductase [Mycolicibacterium sp. CBMA 360]MUL62585.1 NAD(P)-dependent oxidoreductase [Mycolicibacterium sp. CBMA 335]MUL69037.1 NAD(P)-dependent oxidoreductase [Mycolicibacterium sp. CBMA 311]MUL96976.1 NAD(P)-dependent oxidoreductase [Mycolicibacterium sp. CBMA 230]MUM03986.1 hypothetical protein [Mycolicibacterium sp. CBMA 213]
MTRRTAFVGLGRMGLPMAKRLLAVDDDYAVYDTYAGARDEATRQGLPVASSLSEAVDGADLVFVSLPTPAVVDEVIRGEGGVFDHLAGGAVVVDLSTSPPQTARELAAEGLTSGIRVVDAPVSGGPPRAADGTLTIMVGAEPAAYTATAAHLELMGSRVLHMGAPGAGQATKLCNNLLVGIIMTGVAEAVTLAEAESLDLAQLFEVLSTSTADSSVLRRRFPVAGVVADAPASHGFSAQFPIALMHKDLVLAADAAAVHDLMLPVTDLTRARYREALEDGIGELDYSAIKRLYRI